jgi:diadenosine tetraphosphatase ApaH/serine/threonine PP2A family protein phosphatase
VLAVLYDIHANLPALEAVVSDARAQGADRFLLGGDYAGFGPFPHETLELLRTLEPAIWIRGNNERWLREPPLDRPEVVPGVRQEAEELGAAIVDWLYGLPERVELDGNLYVHGSPLSDVESFHSEPRPGEEQLLDGVRGRTVVFGHGHLQFRRPGPDENDLVSPGSVGMPLDRDTRAAWATWDGDFHFRRVEYDIERAVAAARGLGEWGRMMAQRYTHASD